MAAQNAISALAGALCACYCCRMPDEDLNLLTALDALLCEGSVASAARRLGLSASAMSRTLARLRTATGDPLLVRAGRGLVPTPHATALRERVGDLAHEARALLRPARTELDMAALQKTFTVRANEGFVEAFAARIVAASAAQAPGVRIRFAPKPDKDFRVLREGIVDLEVGVLGASGPEVRIQALFRDRFVGVVRDGHPLADGTPITPDRYVAHGHVVASRRGRTSGPVDDALAALGLSRRIDAIVPGFPAALAVAGESDLVALATLSFSLAEIARRRGGSQPLRDFPLPVQTAGITVSQMWHPRMDIDPAHRWLRSLFVSTCRCQPLPADLTNASSARWIAPSDFKPGGT